MNNYIRDVIITFNNGIGLVNVIVDAYGFTFKDGFCCFSDGCKDYKIPVENIKYIL